MAFSYFKNVKKFLFLPETLSNLIQLCGLCELDQLSVRTLRLSELRSTKLLDRTHWPLEAHIRVNFIHYRILEL